MKNTSLRQARAEDLEFLWDLHVASMKDYVEATWGWDETWQRDNFVSHYEPNSAEIIQCDGEDVGLLTVSSLGAFVFLKQLALLLSHQRKGIGSYLVKDIVTRAHSDRCSVLLQVIKVNPARGLYERLGFRVCGETATHYSMINEP